ncbi:PH domain-containing protein [Streptomyces sp. NPDC047097]|uniref:PH domain-containing protein n=1 Tax=Streptomyces sp. NPDC047097 TaxID=3155260 RepID=UPI0033F16085
MTSPTPSPEQPSEPTYADRAYRSPMGIAGGVLLLVLALWLGGDALLRGDGARVRWVAVAGLLLVVPLVTAFTLRPAVFAGADRLRVRNPFRTIVLPWTSVAEIRAGYSTEAVSTGGTVYQLWAVPVSLRKRKQANRRRIRAEAAERRQSGAATDPDLRRSARSTPAHHTSAGPDSHHAPGDQVVKDLNRLAEEGAIRPTATGEPVVRWAYEVIAPAVVGAVALAVLLATG